MGLKRVLWSVVAGVLFLFLLPCNIWKMNWNHTSISYFLCQIKYLIKQCIQSERKKTYLKITAQYIWFSVSNQIFYQTEITLSHLFPNWHSSRKYLHFSAPHIFCFFFYCLKFGTFCSLRKASDSLCNGRHIPTEYRSAIYLNGCCVHSTKIQLLWVTSNWLQFQTTFCVL